MLISKSIFVYTLVIRHVYVWDNLILSLSARNVGHEANYIFLRTGCHLRDANLSYMVTVVCGAMCWVDWSPDTRVGVLLYPVYVYSVSELKTVLA